MKRLMIVLIVVVIVAGLVGVLVWLGPIEINITQTQTQKGPDITKAPEPNKPAAEPNEPNKPAEPNEPNEPSHS